MSGEYDTGDVNYTAQRRDDYEDTIVQEAVDGQKNSFTHNIYEAIQEMGTKQALSFLIPSRSTAIAMIILAVMVVFYPQQGWMWLESDKEGISTDKPHPAPPSNSPEPSTSETSLPESSVSSPEETTEETVEESTVETPQGDVSSQDSIAPPTGQDTYPSTGGNPQWNNPPQNNGNNRWQPTTQPSAPQTGDSSDSEPSDAGDNTGDSYSPGAGYRGGNSAGENNSGNNSGNGSINGASGMPSTTQ